MAVFILEAAEHLGKQAGWSVSNLKMQKILYIAHQYHLGNYGEPLVHALFEAWDYRPVHPDLYHLSNPAHFEGSVYPVATTMLTGKMLPQHLIAAPSRPAGEARAPNGITH